MYSETESCSLASHIGDSSYNNQQSNGGMNHCQSYRLINFVVRASSSKPVTVHVSVMFSR
jgi:hypothetical protein